MDDDRDPEIRPMSREDMATFDYDMEVAVEMMERTHFAEHPVSGEEAYHQANEAVRNRRREERRNK